MQWSAKGRHSEEISWALERALSKHMGLAVPRHAESPQTGYRTHVPRTDRRILDDWTTMEVQMFPFSKGKKALHFPGSAKPSTRVKVSVTNSRSTCLKCYYQW